MKNEIATKMSPEGLTIANTYLEVGNVPAVCARLKMDTAKVSEILNKREIKAYIDQVYLDTGYRNRFKLANSLDDLIERKLEEAEESQIYTNKDLADLYVMAHRMRGDEMKAMTELEKAKASNIKNQTNVQINADLPFGQGNYGKLMEKLLSEDNNGNK
jgi:phage terminase small subunit